MLNCNSYQNDELPSSVGSLINLLFLTADKNRLGALPATIAECSQLCILTVRENLISSLPADFSKLSSLTVLDVACNRLDYLPGSYRELNLRAMWLSDNQSKPLVDLQEDTTPEGVSVLVNYLLPQAPPDTEEIDGFGNTGMTSESESEAESSPPVNYRESKIFFDVLPKESQPLFRHPTPTPKQLKVLKAQRTSYLSQENGATAVPVRPVPGLPAMDYDEDEEEESDDPDDAPTSPLLQNGFRMSADRPQVTSYTNPLTAADDDNDADDDPVYENLTYNRTNTQ